VSAPGCFLGFVCRQRSENTLSFTDESGMEVAKYLFEECGAIHHAVQTIFNIYAGQFGKCG